MVIVLMYLLIFFLGASIGSFVNVLISRSVEGKSWTKGRSKCDHCGKELAWYDMFPLLSYALYRGKSRCCKQPLSIQHPVVEMIFGLLFVWWLAVGSLFFHLVAHPLSTLQPIFWLLMGIILGVIFVTDLFYGLIPISFVYAGIGVTLIYRMILISSGIYLTKDLLTSIGAALVAWGFIGFLRWVTKGRGMGDGDVILAILLGFLVGWPRMIAAILASFIIGAAVSIVLITIGSKKMRSTVPFGPFMIMGIATSLIWGEQIIRMIWGQ